MPDSIVHLVIWLIVLAPVAAVLTAVNFAPRSDRIYWACMAYMVSVPAEVARLLGYQWGMEWLASNLYPALQLTLFAMAVSGAYPALMVGLVLSFLASGHVLVNGIAEPGMVVRVIGGILIGMLAYDGDDRLRAPVVMYCVAGATAWILWFPYMEVYGLGAWLGYGFYQATRFASFGLFIHAARRWREP